MMDSSRAWKIIEKGDYGKGDISDQEKEFLFREAQGYLVREDPQDLDITSFNLAMSYLEEEEFDLALKYFEIGAAMGSSLPLEQAGRIHYYGLARDTSMEKAYQYLKAADDKKWINSSYLLADMYRYGQYVTQDEDKFIEIMHRIERHFANNEKWRNSTPEVMLRIAEIWSEEGDVEAGYGLLSKAEMYMKQRISLHERKRTPHADVDTLLRIQNDMFGDEPESFETIDLLDIFYIVQHELADSMNFYYGKKEHPVKLVREDEGFISVFYNEQWYRSPRAFIDKAMLGEERLRSMALTDELMILPR